MPKRSKKNNEWIVAGSVALLAVVLYFVYSYSGLIKTTVYTNNANISAKITISEVFNTKQGDTTPNSFFGNGDKRSSGESFPLITNGKVVTDSNLPTNVDGLSVQRGDGFIKVSMDSRRTKGKEGASGTVSIEGTTFTSIKSEGRPEKVEDQKKRDARLGRNLRDEAVLASSTQAKFTLTSGPKIDTFTIFYATPAIAAATPTATPAVTATPKSGNPDCSNGKDDDGDGATDLADFSCQNNANHNDEGSPKAACQDGIDNDKDGKTDMNDPGCESNQDNDETNAKAAAAPAKITVTTCVDQNGNVITSSDKNIDCNNINRVKNAPVPVTAKTGPTEAATIATTIIASGSGLAYALRKYLK